MRKFALCVLVLLTTAPSFADDKAESAHDRVMKTKTLRCGYLPFDPYITKDMATGELGGIAVEYINTVAARQGLKVDWSSEVNVDQIVPNLDGGRIDAFCLPCSPAPAYEAVLDFAGGFGDLPYYVYVGKDSTLNADTLKTATFAVIDGYIPILETPIAFPDAKINSLPQTTSMGELYDQIRYGKVDALINEDISALAYMKNNPEMIRKFSPDPVVVKHMLFPVKQDDPKMTDFMNQNFSMEQKENRDLLSALMKKYGIPADSLLIPAGPKGE